MSSVGAPVFVVVVISSGGDGGVWLLQGRFDSQRTLLGGIGGWVRREGGVVGDSGDAVVMIEKVTVVLHFLVAKSDC